MKILEKTPEGVFKVEKPTIKTVERDFTIQQIERKISKIDKEIASLDSLIGKRAELQEILDLMNNYNG